MRRMKSAFSCLLALLLVIAAANYSAVSAAELEVPISETMPAETIPAETVLSETIPTETVPVETMPAETVPPETVPMETVAQEQTAQTEPEGSVDSEVSVIPSLEELPAAEAGYDRVPLYFQTDYPNHMYGSGSSS